uniref:Phage protein n=1 Tax=Parastrongyloides trichosuri TaxID=131310 RepID=A0A0N4Z070_PARTI
MTDINRIEVILILIIISLIVSLVTISIVLSVQGLVEAEKVRLAMIQKYNNENIQIRNNKVKEIKTKLKRSNESQNVFYNVFYRNYELPKDIFENGERREILDEVLMHFYDTQNSSRLSSI